jgi:hypothetical protein
MRLLSQSALRTLGLCAALNGWAHGATVVETRDTVIRLEALPSAPRVIDLQRRGGRTWRNGGSEALIEKCFRGREELPLRWRLQTSREEPGRAAYVYESQSPHLRLTWEWRARADFGPVEHEIRIENLSGEELWLPLQDSLRFDWQGVRGLELEQWYVEKGAGKPSNVGTHRTPVEEGYRWAGTSSTYARAKRDEPREVIPWMLVEERAGAQSGWYAGIEFSGRTRLELERRGDSLRATAGLNGEPGPFRTRLRPGESFETPVVFAGAASGGADAVGNELRPWVRRVLNHARTWENPDYPLTVNNSWGSGMAVNETLARKMIQDSAELGLEMFHIDAGWFRGVGDWHPDPVKFPHGLAAVAEEAHRAGLKFGIWSDWTQAGLSREPGALNVRDPRVRDWLVSDLPADWKPQEFRGQTIDLGVPQAEAWAQGEVERMVKEYRLDMLEHDGYLVAQGCTRSDHPHAPPDPTRICVQASDGAVFVDSDNSADVSYHSVRAYYNVYSKLREKHPDLLLEACNDGGRMVDFGTAAHTDYFSITDAYDPVSNRQAFYDASHVLPAAMLETYVEKWPAPRIENFRYMLRSGMLGWVTIMQDTNAWTAEQHAAAKEEIRLYKTRLRPLIRDADLYHVSTRPDGVHWDGLEYFDARRAAGVLYAFRGSSADAPQHLFALRGLREDASYRVRFQDGSSRERTMSGRELMRSGLRVDLRFPDSSELVFLDEMR